MDETLTPQTEAERADGIRQAALHHAISVVGDKRDPDIVIHAAKAFEAFLRGEGSTDGGA